MEAPRKVGGCCFIISRVGHLCSPAPPCPGFPETHGSLPSQLWPLQLTAMPLLVPETALTPGHPETPHFQVPGVFCSPSPRRNLSWTPCFPGFPLTVGPLLLCAPHWWNVCLLPLQCPGECGRGKTEPSETARPEVSPPTPGKEQCDRQQTSHPL